MKRPKTVRTSVDIPEPLHRELGPAAARRRLSLDPPIVPSTGVPIDPTEARLYDLELP